MDEKLKNSSTKEDDTQALHTQTSWNLSMRDNATSTNSDLDRASFLSEANAANLDMTVPIDSSTASSTPEAAETKMTRQTMMRQRSTYDFGKLQGAAGNKFSRALKQFQASFSTSSYASMASSREGSLPDVGRSISQRGSLIREPVSTMRLHDEYNREKVYKAPEEGARFSAVSVNMSEFKPFVAVAAANASSLGRERVDLQNAPQAPMPSQQLCRSGSLCVIQERRVRGCAAQWQMNVLNCSALDPTLQYTDILTVPGVGVMPGTTEPCQPKFEKEPSNRKVSQGDIVVDKTVAEPKPPPKVTPKPKKRVNRSRSRSSKANPQKVKETPPRCVIMYGRQYKLVESPPPPGETQTCPKATQVPSTPSIPVCCMKRAASRPQNDPDRRSGDDRRDPPGSNYGYPYGSRDPRGLYGRPPYEPYGRPTYGYDPQRRPPNGQYRRPPPYVFDAYGRGPYTPMGPYGRPAPGSNPLALNPCRQNTQDLNGQGRASLVRPFWQDSELQGQIPEESRLTEPQGQNIPVVKCVSQTSGKNQNLTQDPNAQNVSRSKAPPNKSRASQKTKPPVKKSRSPTQKTVEEPPKSDIGAVPKEMSQSSSSHNTGGLSPKKSSDEVPQQGSSGEMQEQENPDEEPEGENPDEEPAGENPDEIPEQEKSGENLEQEIPSEKPQKVTPSNESPQRGPKPPQKLSNEKVPQSNANEKPLQENPNEKAPQEMPPQGYSNQMPPPGFPNEVPGYPYQMQPLGYSYQLGYPNEMPPPGYPYLMPPPQVYPYQMVPAVYPTEMPPQPLPRTDNVPPINYMVPPSLYDDPREDLPRMAKRNAITPQDPQYVPPRDPRSVRPLEYDPDYRGPLPGDIPTLTEREERKLQEQIERLRAEEQLRKEREEEKGKPRRY